METERQRGWKHEINSPETAGISRHNEVTWGHWVRMRYCSSSASFRKAFWSECLPGASYLVSRGCSTWLTSLIGLISFKLVVAYISKIISVEKDTECFLSWQIAFGLLSAPWNINNQSPRKNWRFWLNVLCIHYVLTHIHTSKMGGKWLQQAGLWIHMISSSRHRFVAV